MEGIFIDQWLNSNPSVPFYGQAGEDKTKLISVKISESLLATFRHQCELEDVKYQTQIKALMRQWLHKGLEP